MTFKLFNYPQQAIFGKILPKSKIYEFAKPSNAVKELFVKQVEQIVWEYKLSPETINIPPGEGVEEIQILKIYSKVPEIDAAVFRTIDEAIPSHVFYEVTYKNSLKLVAAYKRPSEVDFSKWVTGLYFESQWFSRDELRVSMPIAINMDALYSILLRNLMGQAHHEGQSLKEQVDRLSILNAKKSEYEKLMVKLSKEKQFNRKIELNQRLRVLSELISKLNS